MLYSSSYHMTSGIAEVLENAVSLKLERQKESERGLDRQLWKDVGLL